MDEISLILKACLLQVEVWLPRRLVSHVYSINQINLESQSVNVYERRVHRALKPCDNGDLI